jgi:serine/threonine protein kinase
MSGMTKEQLKDTILLDVVTSFANLKQGTARRSLLIKYKNQPASVAIFDLTSHNIIRRKNNNAITSDEEYLPSAAAFELCGDNRLREEAKNASTVVLRTLQNMFIGEQKKEGFNFQDLKRHVEHVYTNSTFDDETLKLGLYLARDLGSLSGYGLTQPDETEVEWFQIAESAANMPNPENEWDRVMAGYKRSVVAEEMESPPEARWEQVRRLGGGGQSDVFLVRSPARATQRAACLRTMRAALDQDKRAELAEAMWSYSRPDSLSELGAMKVFKIRDEGGEQQAIGRLKQEFKILSENRPGLPKLLASNESERWIVTEFFPEGTLEDNILRYEGKPVLALKAFLSLVNTVAQLHDDGIVHRDIKPANVFVRQSDELVLGDFGIVFLPDQPARLTRTNESVGPHDYMPPWADVGGRLEEVDCNFDVYMLGKLLWCMVSGRAVLRREWFRLPQNDISVMFRDDPHAFMINIILEKCVVERQQDCVGIHDLRAMVIAFVSLIDQGGQLLQAEVPRPCHVCGVGEYEPEVFNQSSPIFKMRFWGMSGGPGDINLANVRLFVCDRCGHVEFFRASPR